MEKYLKSMKEEFDKLFPVSESLYKSLSLFLNLRKLQKGEILKSFNEIENKSRYICEGFVGVYKKEILAKSKIEESQLKYVLQDTDNAFDMVSYSSSTLTRVEIKAISEVVFFEFSKEGEREIILRYPEFAQLGILINHRIQERFTKQTIILRKPFKIAYSLFLERYPGIEKYLKYEDWSGLFGISERTVCRVISEHIED